MTNKTVPTSQSVEVFLRQQDPSKYGDAMKLVEIMREISHEEPVMWGTSIIGFGSYRYTYASGRTGNWMRIGFSPRKAAISLYLNCDAEVFSDELTKLGKHTSGKGCIYIKKLTDIDIDVLRNMCQKAYDSNQ